MKRFKRISIVLSIFIVLLLTGIYAWVFYPTTRVSVTKDDIACTEELMDKKDISVPEKLYKKGSGLISCPSVKYRTDNVEKLVSDILGDESVQKSDTSFIYKNTTLTIDGRKITVEGKLDTSEEINLENVTGMSKKLIGSLDLDKTNMTLHAYEQEDGYYITAVPEYKNRSVFDGKIKIDITYGGSYSLEAIPVTFSRPVEKVLPVTSCMALAEFALEEGAEGSKVKDVQLGYKIEGNTLVPVWEIMTDEKAYYIE